MSEERKLQFNPKAALEKTQQQLQIHDLNEKIKELESDIAEIVSKQDRNVSALESLLAQMRDVNVNIHPIKPNVFEHWKNQLADILENSTVPFTSKG